VDANPSVDGTEPIRRSDVLHVARLSRVHLEAAEVDRLVKELADILGHFSAIDRGRGEREAAAPGPFDRGLDSRLRSDEPDPDPLVRGPESLAPDWRDGLIVVPRLRALGGEEGS